MARRIHPKANATVEEVLDELRGLASDAHREHAARVGAAGAGALGVSTAHVRRLGREIGVNPPLADALWRTGVHEARLLAVLVADLAAMSREDLEGWLGEIGSWDLCDHFCNALALRAPNDLHLDRLALRWVTEPHLYVRRAGLATIANLAVHQTELDEDLVERFLRAIRGVSGDERAHVKKAASWALREIGKRDFNAHDLAVSLATDLVDSAHGAARWIGRDALRELETLVAVPERRRLLTSRSKMGAKTAAEGS